MALFSNAEGQAAQMEERRRKRAEKNALDVEQKRIGVSNLPKDNMLHVFRLLGDDEQELENQLLAFQCEGYEIVNVLPHIGGATRAITDGFYIFYK